MKYTHDSKLNNVAIPVPKGTISIMLNTQQKNTSFIDTQKMSESARFKLKWKTVEWLFANKREAIEYLVQEKQMLWNKLCQFHPDV